MGRIAGAAGGRWTTEHRTVTRWAFAVDEVPPLQSGPVALILPVPELGSHPPSGDQRRRWRRQTLTTLAAAAIGIDAATVRLVAANDGRRRLGGTDLFASVAHRAGWVAAVLARTPAGIDLESPDEAEMAAEIVLAGVEDSVDLAAWHGLAGMWATREAALKAEGRDLTCDHRHWRFGTGVVRGDDEAALRVDLARRSGIVAAVAYAGG